MPQPRPPKLMDRVRDKIRIKHWDFVRTGDVIDAVLHVDAKWPGHEDVVAV